MNMGMCSVYMFYHHKLKYFIVVTVMLKHLHFVTYRKVKNIIGTFFSRQSIFTTLVSNISEKYA